MLFESFFSNVAFCKLIRFAYIW